MTPVRTTIQNTTLALHALALGALALGCQVIESDIGRAERDSLRFLLESPIFAELEAPMEAPLAGPVENSHIVETAPTARIADDTLVSLQLRGTSLAEALHFVATKAGINIYLDAGLDARVDASFPSITLDDALQSLLIRNGLALVEEPEGIFWVQTADGSQPGMAQFKLKSINAADVEDKLAGLIQAGSTVVVDGNQNLVVVRGTQSDVSAIATYLEAADQLKRQVLVEVSIFEASIGDGFEFGITSTLASKLNTNSLTIMESLATPDTSFSFTINDQDGDVTSTVNAIRRHLGLELVSSPTVLAITNTDATVEVVEEIPYINATSSTSNGGGSTQLEEIEFKEVGIKLTVHPTIQEGGVIQVKIDQELSEVTEFFGGVPVVDLRKLSSQFLVSDRQTIVLGGLMQDRRMESEKGIPILGQIPFVGRLFRSDEDSTDKRELLIFLTPRILDPKQTAGLTSAYKDSYRQARNEMNIPQDGGILHEDSDAEAGDAEVEETEDLGASSEDTDG